MMLLEVYPMAFGSDGAVTSKTTNRELAALYADAGIAALARMNEVIPERFNLFQELTVIDFTQAAHYGRKALRQSKLR